MKTMIAGIAGAVALVGGGLYIALRSSEKKHNDKQRVLSFTTKQKKNVKNFVHQLVHTEHKTGNAA